MATGSAERGTDVATPPIRSHRFPKSARLRKRREFLAVQQSGSRFHGKYFLAVLIPYTATQHAQTGRTGITVTKKVGNAVVRNRIKRLVREYVRRSAWLDVPADAVIIAKPGAASIMRYAEVANDLDRIHASILKRRLSRSARPHDPDGSSGPKRRPSRLRGRSSC